MAETNYVHFPDISGSTDTYTVFVRNEDTGVLLNTGGDAISEVGSTGLFSWAQAEDRVACKDYRVRIYQGTTETAVYLVFDGILYANMNVVDKPFSATKTVLRGTVGNTPSPTTTGFTPSSVAPAGAVANQWVGRILVFDNDTTTAALRGQATDITAATSAALPALTFTALTTAPVSGDTFSIV